MTRSTSSARAAAKSVASAQPVIAGPSSSTSRKRSPSAVPPGSRSSTTSRPSPRSHSASSAAWVVFPEPSMPSNVTNIVLTYDTSMRAVVTGGAGFVGSHLVDALVARGDEVTVIDNLASGKRENLNDAAAFLEHDILEGIDAAGADVVFHLAAQADVQTSVRRPDYDAEVNVVGTVKVAEAARAAGAQVVFSSTGGAIYGECDEPAPESSPLNPLSPYGIAKLCAEEYLLGWNRIHGSKNVVLRFANVYGPRQDSGLEGGVVSIFLERMARGEDTTIYGDGLQERDFVYVGDVVSAILAAVGHAGGVLNVGTGEATSVLDLHRACSAVAGSEAPPSFAPPRLGDIQRSVLDPSHAAAELGWASSVELDDGLRRTWEWMSAS